ncbi:MAG TPA: DNA-3-methyladenine glycosylase [Solirubrobacterales bacterium]|nr:DNA-3-methyladenine glycosylase [Solirubrobacterales bacterium]
MSAYDELAASDPRIAALIERFGELSFETRRRGRPRTDSYGSLVRSVVAQQLSAKAAATIFDRVLALFGGRTPTPAELLAVSEERLREAGLSGRKVEYLRDLARHVESGKLELDRFATMSDDEVIAEITAVRGFGVWTAQVFLMFHLERPDVLPTGDLGIRRAAQIVYGLAELPEHDELTRIAEPWRPHRTLACIYLWETLHAAPA